MQNSLLQKAGGAFRLHDLLLDFVAIKSRGEDALIEEAVERQARHLGTLAVLQRYSLTGKDKLEGLYSLLGLWQKLTDLSGKDHLVVDAYNTSLGELGEGDLIYTSNACLAVGALYQLQVDSLWRPGVAVC